VEQKSGILKGPHIVDAERNHRSLAGDSPAPPDRDIAEYCREIETYLCRKNDGHLIRVVGPSFDLVSRWAHDGVPLKVALAGIDRYFERYYRKGPRRRPVRIDFCEADVLDVFDEWRRATGLTGSGAGADEKSAPRRGSSLPEHLERVLLKLTNAQATGILGVSLDPLIDQLSAELDRAKKTSGGVRGEARRAMSERLAAADASLLTIARPMVAPDELEAMRRDVDAILGSAADHMAPEARERARQRALDQLIRERLHLPTVTFA
jgi:hypothetical protein